MTPTHNIYTDGSCLGNPGPGGWAAIIEHDGQTEQLSGADPGTTNNRMEITAAIKGIGATPAGAAVVVHSDSEYVVKTMTKGWKRNANRDLWEELDRLIAQRNVDFKWVRGHDGHPQNEQADRLAVAAMKNARDIPGARGARPGSQGASGRGNSAAPSAFRGSGAGTSTGRERPEPTAVHEGASRAPGEQRGLTHIDAQGAARMVDVGEKPDSDREATAAAAITMRPETLALILQGKMPKGDVFTVARIAGVNAAKHTWELIPLAHQIPLSHVEVDFETDPQHGQVAITARARTTAKTGVEMEALAAASAAALTIYDMCKASDRAMTIGGIRLLAKAGGTHGDYQAE